MYPAILLHALRAFQAGTVTKMYLYLKITEKLAKFRSNVQSELKFLLMGSYTGCPGGNVPDFGRMFLTLKYTDITQNTYIRS